MLDRMIPLTLNEVSFCCCIYLTEVLKCQADQEFYPLHLQDIHNKDQISSLQYIATIVRFNFQIKSVDFFPVFLNSTRSKRSDC